MGGSRTGGTLGDLQHGSVSDRGGVCMGLHGGGGLRSNTGGRGHGQGGHRPALLAC